MGQTWAGVYAVVLEETVVTVRPCGYSSIVGWQRSSMLAEVEAGSDSRSGLVEMEQLQSEVVLEKLVSGGSFLVVDV